jgi:alginate O-acetyltransferase complex protein AlgI
LGIFLFSGLVHETVISVPPRGGWGLPTTYFLIQALGLVFERSRLGRRWRLDGGMRGRFFSLTVVGLPLPLLVHAPFLERVIVPMLEAAS